MGDSTQTHSPLSRNADLQLHADLQDERLTRAGLLAESSSGFAHLAEQHLLAGFGLPLHWFVLMLRIARSPERRLRLSDLASQTGMSPSGLTRAFDKLEAAGYTQRVACPDDRRTTWATVTPTGLALLAPALRSHLDHIDDTLLAPLTPDEQAQLTRLLRKVRDHVNPDAAIPPTALPD